jgi:hypothetical protein
MAFKRFRPRIWNPYSRTGARWHGWLDARQNPPLPRWDAPDPSPYLRQLHEAAGIEIADTLRGFVERDTPIDNKLQRLIADERLLKERLTEAEKAHREAAGNFARLNPDVPVSAVTNRVWAYWVVVAFLLMCEIPFNGTVFQVLREGQLFNYLISAGIGILILLAAHYAGVHLRQKPFADRASTVMFIVALIVPVLTVFVIASLRQYYLHARHLVDPIGERIAYFTFLFVNLLMFAVAFYMSWFSHLVGAEELIRTRRMLSAVTDALKATEKQLRVTRATRLNVHRQHVNRAHQVISGFWQLVHLYADVNVRWRKDRQGRTSDRLLTDAAQKSLYLKLPRALEPLYLDYRDPASAEVRSVGASAASITTPRDTSATTVNEEGDTVTGVAG